jgi:Family of unknown function (DUF6252)
MKRKIILYALLILFGAACNSNNEKTAPDKSAQTRPEAATSNIPAGKTYLTAEINGKAFVSNAQVAAIDIGDDYVIGGENDEFVLSIHIPKNSTTGAKMVQAEVATKNPAKKLFQESMAAITIEKINDKEITGTFTITGANDKGEMKTISNGKFSAIVYSTPK